MNISTVAYVELVYKIFVAFETNFAYVNKQSDKLEQGYRYTRIQSATIVIGTLHVIPICSFPS